LLCQSNTGYAWQGVSVAFQDSSNGVVAQGVSVAFQNSSNGVVTQGVSVAFQNSSQGIAVQGLSVAFVTASDRSGRGVSVSFGTVTPPTTPPPTAATYGGTGAATNQQAYVAEPVNTATGDYYNSVTDLAVPGRGLNFAMTRGYNSLNASNGPLGYRWTHTYNVYLAVDSSGNVTVTFGDGHQETYQPLPGGSGFTPPAGVYNVLTTNPDTTYTLASKTQTQFNFNLSGNLATIRVDPANTAYMSLDGVVFGSDGTVLY